MRREESSYSHGSRAGQATHEQRDRTIEPRSEAAGAGREQTGSNHVNVKLDLGLALT